LFKLLAKFIKLREGMLSISFSFSSVTTTDGLSEILYTKS